MEGTQFPESGGDERYIGAVYKLSLIHIYTTHVYEVLHAMSDYYNKKGRKVNVICDFNPYTTI